MFNYTDPYEAARQARENTGPQVRPVAPYLGEPATATPGAPGVPLGDLQGQVAGVLNAADSHHTYMPGPGAAMLQYPRGRQPSVAGDMLKGAAVGFGAWLVWRQMKRRKARTGEYTHPFFRFLAIWWGFMIAGFGLSMMWVMETGWFLGIAFVAGTVLSPAYLIYRFTGHGRYNSRRAGSPFRANHRRS